MAKHLKKEALILFSKEIAQAVTGMTPGVMNYMGGRPKVSRSIHLQSFLLDKNLVSMGFDINNEKSLIPPYKKNNKIIINKTKIKFNSTVEGLNLDSSVPLINLAYARSGDKGDHANIGIIARKPEYLPFIKNENKTEAQRYYLDNPQSITTGKKLAIMDLPSGTSFENAVKVYQQGEYPRKHGGMVMRNYYDYEPRSI